MGYPYFPADYQPCTSDWAIEYLSRKDVQAALRDAGRADVEGQLERVRRHRLFAGVGRGADDARYQRLLRNGTLRMAIMSGDDDSVCATLGTQQFIWDLGLPVQSDWAPVHGGRPRLPSGPACKQVAGYAVKFDGLSLVTVHGAGHLVPATWPSQGFEVLKRSSLVRSKAGRWAREETEGVGACVDGRSLWRF